MSLYPLLLLLALVHEERAWSRRRRGDSRRDKRGENDTKDVRTVRTINMQGIFTGIFVNLLASIIAKMGIRVVYGYQFNVGNHSHSCEFL